MPSDVPHVTYSVDQRRDFSTLIRDPRAVELAVAGVGDEFMFGSIQWDKSLGRPTSAAMADGFEITLIHYTTVLIGDAMGGAAHEKKLSTPSGPISKWDAEDDAQRHYVHFVRSPLVNGREYTVEIKLAQGVDWSDHNFAGTWLRNMQPSARGFTKELTPTWLEPFEVIATPFIFIDP